MIFDSSQQRLFSWFMRKTTNSAVRRLAELPIAIATDIGLIRSENQDRTAVLRIQLTENHSFVVVILCDGMGGMRDGSECAALAITSFLLSCVQTNNRPLKERILISVEKANDVVFKKYGNSGGATLSALIADTKEGFLAVNVGDSRIYSIENDKLLQKTTDDTIAGQVLSENKTAYRSNELLQYIGIGQGIEPHIISFPSNTMLTDILLTSDGLHFLNTETMESVIKCAPDYAAAIKRLTELAKWCGGHDNASGIIVSNLSSLFETKPVFDPQSIDIWDAFGELRILIPEYNVKPDIKNPVNKNIKPTTTKKTRKTIEAGGNKVDSVKTDKVKTNKQVEIPVPELQINFSFIHE